MLKLLSWWEPMQKYILTLDVGGTKVESGRVEARGGTLELVYTETFLTETFPRGVQQVFIDRIVELVVEHRTGQIEAFGLSFHGTVDQDGNVLWSSLLGNATPVALQTKLRARLGIPVVVANDVLCQAEAEAICGLGQAHKHVTVVNLGTGLRIAQIVDGRVVIGGQGSAGSVGWLSLDFPDLPAPTPFHDLLAGYGLTRVYNGLGGDEIGAEGIFKRVKQGERRAERALTIFTAALGKLFLLISAFYNPEVIVLTGSLTLSSDMFLKRICDEYEGNLPKIFRPARVVVSRLEHSATLGAAILASRKLESQGRV